MRVDEVGRAEAVAYEAATAQADPLDPTTKYSSTGELFSNPLLQLRLAGRRYVVDHFGYTKRTGDRGRDRSHPTEGWAASRLITAHEHQN